MGPEPCLTLHQNKLVANHAAKLQAALCVLGVGKGNPAPTFARAKATQRLRQHSNVMQTLRDVLCFGGGGDGETPALVLASNPATTLSRSQLIGAVDGLAARLAAGGVRAGRAVALSFANSVRTD
jgi:hypothetical protein